MNGGPDVSRRRQRASPVNRTVKTAATGLLVTVPAPTNPSVTMAMGAASVAPSTGNDARDDVAPPRPR